MTSPRAGGLTAALETARQQYVDTHPESAAWAQRAATVLPGGTTRSVLAVEPFPIRMLRADGPLLWDVDGHEYIDLLGDFTAGMLGHRPATVLTAVTDALANGWSLGGVHRDEVRFAELITERFESIEQVRFTNSGTEANLLALAAAIHHTGRRRIVVFEHGYHGGVLTFGREPSPVDVPHEWVLLPYNDIDAARAAFAELGDQVAAVLVEPLQGSAGCFPGDPEFLAALREECTRHGALLVFDEVMTSRLSTGGAQQLLGIRPDITTLGKYLAGGMSFGAFGGGADVMAHFDPARGGTLGHAGTFNNNVATMAAGVAVLEQVLSPDVLTATNARGDRLREAINATFARQRTPMTATGSGSLLTVHGVAGPVRSAADLDGADDRWKELLYLTAANSGFYVARRGFIALSIEVTDAHVDAFVATVAAMCAGVRVTADEG